MKASIDQIVTFLQDTLKKAHKTNLIVAVSGGIDSAVSLSLACKAVGPDHVWGVSLPYHTQSIEDSHAILEWNNVPKDHQLEINIGPMVDEIAKELKIPGEETLRLGNIMARMRMIALYDQARVVDALVCGTENKSEKYLGYFTRFGDEASDIEPIQHLYKHEVRELAQTLGIPDVFLTKHPSAGLWEGQTDESELGFTYDQADQVIAEMLGELEKDASLPDDVRQEILERIESVHFKHEVPYAL